MRRPKSRIRQRSPALQLEMHRRRSHGDRHPWLSDRLGRRRNGAVGGACRLNEWGGRRRWLVHSLVLKSDGTVVAWGYDNDGETDIPADLTNVVAIGAGLAHNLALKSDGTVAAWGYDNDGETDVPAGLTNVVAVAAGGWHSLALKSDGTVVAWGDDSAGQTDVPAGLRMWWPSPLARCIVWL